jgi:hypothetical protein
VKIFLIAVAVLVVIHLLRGRKPAPAVVAAPSRLLPVLAAAAAVMGVSWWEATHPAKPAAAAPVPAPVPTVTRTVAPHVTNFHFPLTGGDIVAMWIIGGVVAIVLVGAVLRRSS